MPPRKVDKSPKKSVEKKPRGRVKKVNPVLKTPTVVKLKIKLPSDTTNVQNSGNEVTVIKDVVKEVKNPVTKKKPIVRRQCAKKKTVNGEPAAKKDAPVKKKDQAKVAFKNDNAVKQKYAIKEEETKYDIPKLNENYLKIFLANEAVNSQFAKKPKHIEKLPIEQVLQANKVVVKNNKVSNGKTVSKKKPVSNGKTVSNKKVVNRKTPTTKVPESKEDNMTSNAKKAEPSDKRKRNLSHSGQVAKAGPKSRKKNIGDKKVKKIKNTDETDTKDQRSASLIDFNKCVNTRSPGTRSNKSWTRDISSSSNSSLVTVLSKDFYFFDNKIPILQLNNIDNELLLRSNKQCVTDNCIEGSKSVADNYRVIKETTNEINKQTAYIKSCLSSTSSSCSDTTKFGLPTLSRTESCGDVGNENLATCSSLRLSASSTSSSSSSSSSSSNSTSSVASGSMIMQKNLDNRLSSEKVIDNTYEPHSVSSTDRALKTTTSTTKTLQKLNLNINKFDINKIKLSQNKNVEINTNIKNLQDKIFRDDVLKDETDLCCLCQAIMQLEIDDVDKYFNHNDFLASTLISHPKTPETINSQDDRIVNEHEEIKTYEGSCNENVDNIQHDPPEEVENNKIVEKIDESCLANSKPNYSSFVDNDDDDALSLFAESLTEIESCRRNSTFHSEMSGSEEYVPQPIVAHAIQSRSLISYQPTKISKVNLENKKQKADSSALSGNNLDLRENSLIYEDRMGSFSQSPLSLSNNGTKNTLGPNTPRLMALIHKPAHGRKSLVFKGCCYFFLKTICHKPACTFPHIYLNVNDVKNSLKMLSEESFIQEYMLMRTSPKLRRRYGLCFVEESMRRELTRIVVEMAIDFIVRISINSTEDNALKSEVIDNVLMYLNKVDLSTCDDLLGYNVKYVGKVLLCDFFMSVIATSQNFSRFKSVFINLTDFMYQNGRTFSVEVAESILERLCILPYDEALARSLLKILKNTDVTVFSNTQISDLERQLLTSNSDLYHEFKFLKDQALVNQSIHGNHYEPTYEPLLNTDVERLNTNFGHKDKNIIRQDMSDLGNTHKPPIETKFTMTIDLKKLKQSGFSVNANTTSTESVDYGVNNPFLNGERHHVIGISKNNNSKWTIPSILGICENANTNSTESMDHSVNSQSMKWMTPSHLLGSETATTSSKFMKHGVNNPMKWTRPGIKEIGEANTSKGMQNGAKKPKNNWRNRSFDNFCNRTPIASFPLRPSRGSFKRHSDRSYEGSAAKFRRGPNMNT